MHEAYLRLAIGQEPVKWSSRAHFFAAAAEALGISPRKADLLWSFARAWLRREIEGSP